MNFDLAKRNRLNGKFDFDLRDWQFELDGLEDFPPAPLRRVRPKNVKPAPKPDDAGPNMPPTTRNAG